MQSKARLLQLLEGNQNACDELISKIRFQNPGIDEQECYEKAINRVVKDKGNKFKLAWGFNFF